MHVILTVDSLPIPPFKGHNRVILDWLDACAETFELDLIVYAQDEELELLRSRWPQANIRFHCLRRNKKFQKIRSIKNLLSIPTVTRDFDAEAGLVEKLRRNNTRLLINYLSGAPLLLKFSGEGTILSGHDCISYFCRRAREKSRDFMSWTSAAVREVFALNAERRFAHLARRVHVVSNTDAENFKTINPRISAFVIPLGRNTPPLHLLKSWHQRSENLIWGSLETQPIIAGLRLILKSAVLHNPQVFKNWLLIGRVPESQAYKLLPELGYLKIRYKSHVENIGDLLGRSKRVVIPDLSGTGQKTRTLDSFAFGCCTIGFKEAFRNAESHASSGAYLCKETSDDLVKLIGMTNDAESEAIASKGNRVFVAHFSSAALREKWKDLFNEVGALPTIHSREVNKN